MFCPKHLDHFSVINVGILYKHNGAVTRGVTSRDIFLWLTETACVLNFMTSNECRRKSYRCRVDTCSLRSDELARMSDLTVPYRAGHNGTTQNAR
jgi:hypothetical protein